MTEIRRLAFLDGLRGLAAAVVVIEHMSALFFPAPRTAGLSAAGQLVMSAAAFPIRAGNFSVYIFFAISGVVISMSASRGVSFPSTFARRYLRLTIPMLFASALAWVLLMIFPDELPQMGKMVSNHWTETNYQSGAPSIWSALREASWGVYAAGYSYVDPAMWSMKIELIGSCGLYILYLIPIARIRLALLVAMPVVLELVGFPDYLGFPVGAALFELAARDRIHPSARSAIVLLVLAVLGAIFVETPVARYAYTRLHNLTGLEFSMRVTINSIGGCAVVYAAMTWPALRGVLLQRLPLALGRISYSLYLVHMPLLFTVFAAVMMLFTGPPGALVSAILAIAFFALLVIVAWIMTVIVDEPTTRSLKRFPRATLLCRAAIRPT